LTAEAHPSGQLSPGYSLDLALEAANLLLWDWHDHQGLIEWYPFLPSRFPLQAAELPRSNEQFWEMIHPEDREAVRAQILACLKGLSTEFLSEHRFRKADGSTCWVESRGRVLRREGTRVVRMQGVILETTGRRRVEDALRRSGENLRRILNRLPARILMVDETGAIRFMTHADMGETPLSLLDLLEPAQHEQVLFNLKRAIQQGEMSQLQARMRFPDHNEERMHNLHFSPMLHGSHAEALLTAEDVEDRHRAEQILRHLQEDSNALEPETLLGQILRQLGELLEADFAFLSELPEANEQRCKAIATYSRHQDLPLFENHLEGTPCGEVIKGGLCVYPRNARTHFPKADFLRELNIEAYVGMPLRASTGKILGVLALMFVEPIAGNDLQTSALAVFGSRAAMELERRHNQAALLWQTERYRHLFHHIQDALIIFSADQLTAVEANEKACALYRIPPEHWPGLDITQLSCEPEATRATMALVAEGKAPNLVERMHRRSDGSLFPIEATLSLMDLQGERYICALVRDVSQAKGQQELISRSTRLLEQAQTIALVGAWEWKGSGESLFWSENLYAILDWPREEAPTWPAFLALVPREWRSALEHALTHNRTVDLDLEIGTRAGKRKWVRLLASASCEGTWSGALQDITRQKVMEQQLAQTHRVESIGRLAGGVAHDFNNLLTAILGHVELARKESDPPKLQDSLAQIHDAAERGAFLSRQLLGFARKQVSRPQAMDFNETVRRTVAWLARVLGEDIRIQCTLQENLPPIHMDPGQFDQIMLNLAINARDAMPHGGVLHLTTGMEQPASIPDHGEAGRFATLILADTGEGIPPEVLPHIFEPFFTTKPVGKGTGLGLSNCYGIMRQNHGHIRAESRPGQGSSFFLFFPLSLQMPGTAAAQPGPLAEPEGSGLILLVEDDDLIRDMVATYLQRLGYRVETASDGAEALHSARGRLAAFDLLITDLVMPNMGGMELASQCLREHANLPILFTSGYSHKPLENKDFPTSQFLAKPFSLPALAVKVRQALEGRSA